jgi:hypothetical protein
MKQRNGGKIISAISFYNKSEKPFIIIVQMIKKIFDVNAFIFIFVTICIINNIIIEQSKKYFKNFS